MFELKKQILVKSDFSETNACENFSVYAYNLYSACDQFGISSKTLTQIIHCGLTMFLYIVVNNNITDVINNHQSISKTQSAAVSPDYPTCASKQGL